MGQPLGYYLCNLVADGLGTCSLRGTVSTVNGKISRYGSHELPHLAVDLADHSYSRRQQEYHLRKSRLSWFGGFAIDDRGDGAS
jgi:hypothetical protein